MTALKRAKAVWITWEFQPRNRSMARELGIPLYEFFFPGSRLRRQLRSVVSTLRVLLSERPAVVFAPNPSLVLTYLLLAIRRLLGFKFASDAHYGGIVAVGGGPLRQRALDFANRRADVVIVTTEAHAARVRQLGGRPFVCPDPLPQLMESDSRPSAMQGITKSVLFTCSFDPDEPFPAVFEAARVLAEHGFTVFTSGRYTRAGISPAAVPHVNLLGYVDRPTYDGLLRSVDVVLDLTTWEDCLVCGAYEAMAAGKPCVLSRTPALTNFFTHGTVFSTHAPSDIAAAVLSAYEKREVFRAQIAEWADRHESASRERIANVRSALGVAPVH